MNLLMMVINLKDFFIRLLLSTFVSLKSVCRTFKYDFLPRQILLEVKSVPYFKLYKSRQESYFLYNCICIRLH